MKKVLLTKSQQIRVTPTDMIKKPQNVVTTTSIINSTGVRLMPVQTNVITNTYMQRKSFQNIYEDIFKLLMRLPDKALQQRVIDAINGRNAIANPNQCKHCSINGEKSPKVNASTQTETIETKETIETRSRSPANESAQEIETLKPVKKEEPSAVADGITADKTPPEPAVKLPRKRGRKRNTCVPQVVKRSAAQMALQEREEKQLTPLPSSKKRKLEASESIVNTHHSGDPKKRRDSTMSSVSSIGDINVVDSMTIDNYINGDNQSTIYMAMAYELIRADRMSDEGLLPIHDAILLGDIQRLQRQIYVWAKLKTNVDFNELLSADGEDCLQLAVTNDCDPIIVKIVLNAGVLPNHIYDESNTALHLAIINNVQLDSLRHLMLQIDLNLLLQTNDDGYTALHIAVRHNRYKMAEIICDTIDQRQLGEPIYRRAANEEEGEEDKSTQNNNRSAEIKDEKKFAKFYERACDRLELSKEKLMRRQLKHEILNAIETRAGNASLFYAVEGELEHLCYFLLAHLANPDEENLSGHSPKSFHYEFARVLRINLKISRIMDKVIGILNGTSR